MDELAWPRHMLQLRCVSGVFCTGSTRKRPARAAGAAGAGGGRGACGQGWPQRLPVAAAEGGQPVGRSGWRGALRDRAPRKAASGHGARRAGCPALLPAHLPEQACSPVQMLIVHAGYSASPAHLLLMEHVGHMPEAKGPLYMGCRSSLEDGQYPPTAGAHGLLDPYRLRPASPAEQRPVPSQQQQAFIPERR